MSSKPEPLPYKPIGFRIALRKQVEELCKLYPERAEEFWSRFNNGYHDRAQIISWVEYEALVAKAKAKPRIPEQPLAVALQANHQSNEQARKRIEEELARERAEEHRREAYRVAIEHAIEEKYAWQQYEAAMAKRYDPCGLWGPMTLTSELD